MRWIKTGDELVLEVLRTPGLEAGERRLCLGLGLLCLALCFVVYPALVSYDPGYGVYKGMIRMGAIMTGIPLTTLTVMLEITNWLEPRRLAWATKVAAKRGARMVLVD